MIKLILCDMDGTLLNEQKELSPKLFPLLDQLKKRNILFGAASGRQYYNLVERFQEYAQDMIFIAENGSMVFQGETCLYTSELPYEDLWKPVARIRQAKQAWGVLCGLKGAYIEQDDSELIENCKMYYHRLYFVADMLKAAQADTICKISIYDAIDTEKNAYPFMKGYDGEKHMVTSGTHWIDITNPNVTKGSAVQALQKQLHIRQDEIMAFGDYMNDFELLQACGESYAMANAHPEILRIAKHRALSNEEDGVVKAICDALHISYEQL